MSDIKTIVVKTTIVIPQVPNFLKQEDGGIIPIEAITDAGLKTIGMAFTENLIEKAQKKRSKEAT